MINGEGVEVSRLGVFLVNMSDPAMLLMTFILAALFTGLVYLGREYYRLAQQIGDNLRVSDLIQNETVAGDNEKAAERLWERLKTDSQALSQVSRRLTTLCDSGGDETPDKCA